VPRELLLGNGQLAVGFDASLALRELSFPRTGQENQTLGRCSDWGLQFEDGILWGDDAGWTFRSRHLGEEGRRAFQEAHHEIAQIGLEIYTDLEADRPLLWRHFRVVGGGRDGRDRRRLFLRHNLVLGESDLGNAVEFDPSLEAVHHYRRDRHVFLAPQLETERWSWTLAREDDHAGLGVRGRVEAHGLDENPCAVGAGDSLLGLDLHREEIVSLALVATSSEAEGRRICGDLTPPPRDFPAAATRSAPLDHPTLALISLGQLRAHQDRGGAIMAGLDSEMVGLARESYAYCWHRDGALVARAALRCGDLDIARRFLAFSDRTLESGGYFRQRYHADGSPASSWHPQPRAADTHLPIQSDETALTALTAAEFLRLEPEQAVARRLLERLLDFLLEYRDLKTGLPRPSHDLWEERFGIHTFTVAATEAALMAGATLNEDRSDELREAATRMRAARHHFLFHRDLNRFARRLEINEGHHHLDMTLDASLLGLDFLFPSGKTPSAETEATLTALATELAVPAWGGVARYSGDQYHRDAALPDAVPGNAWLLTTAWLAAREARRARTAEDLRPARARLDWLLEQAGPSGALSEQIDAQTGQDHSIRPLTWSHAEYLVALIEYERARRRCQIPGDSLLPASLILRDDPW
jgi:glucoamylase